MAYDLKDYLKKKGITKTQVCLTLLVNPQSLYKWTSGRSYPEIEHLKQLSALIGCSVDYLLSGEKTIPTDIEETDNVGEQILEKTRTLPETVAPESQPVEMEIDIFIYDLYLKNELSARAYHVLNRMGKLTLNELCDLTEEDILKYRNAGIGTVKKIKEVLNKYGLSFKNVPETEELPVYEEPVISETEEITDKEYAESLKEAFESRTELLNCYEQKYGDKPTDWGNCNKPSICGLSAGAKEYLKERIFRIEDIENFSVLSMLVRDLKFPSFNTEKYAPIKREILQWLCENEYKQHNERIKLLKKLIVVEDDPLLKVLEKETIPAKELLKEDIRNLALMTAFIRYMKVDSYYKMPIGIKSAIKYLKRQGINTLGDVIKHTKKELMAMRWIGEWSVRMIREVLQTYNLHLKGESE